MKGSRNRRLNLSQVPPCLNRYSRPANLTRLVFAAKKTNILSFDWHEMCVLHRC